MSEMFTGGFEKKEQIPDLDEVWGVFKQIAKVTELRETKREVDEKGLSHWEAESEIEGGRIELEYDREKGENLDQPVISVVYYGTSGYPETGYSVRKLADGTWEGLDN